MATSPPLALMFCEFCAEETPTCLFIACRHAFCWHCVSAHSLCPRCFDPFDVFAPVHKWPVER